MVAQKKNWLVGSSGLWQQFIGLDPVIHTTKRAEEEGWIEHLENYTLSLGLHLYCLNMRVQSFWGKGAQTELKSHLE